MEFIEGDTLSDIECNLSDDEKFIIGRKLRNITDKMNTLCEQFNDIDIIKNAIHNKHWSIMPGSFNHERIEYLRLFKIDQAVYVHGDLNPDNVLLDKNGEIYIIDFADALLAPIEYELPALICELFCFELPFMIGYFKEFDADELTEKYFSSLLMHDFGSNIIKCNLGNIDKITDLATMKARLFTVIKTGKQIGE